MAKLKSSIFGLSASGSISGGLTYLKRMRQQIVEKKPELKDAQTGAQLSWRHMFLKVVALWHALSAAEKLEWESAARPKHMTGYAWFISQALRPNPGIYLPLQGGTMQGTIDMATNRILNLPDPTVNQEPDTRAARIAAILAHIAIAGAHHAAFTAPNHTAIGNGAPHHARYTNAEAVTAAKTVKLDDFATPDDNTDLNASATRHGLFKKLDGVVTHFLNGLGNWVAIAAGKSISTGSYSGDNTNDRQITLGFKCSMVILFSEGSVNYSWIALPDGTMRRTSSGTKTISTDLLLHETDGFVVDDNYANGGGGSPYDYFAISE